MANQKTILHMGSKAYIKYQQEMEKYYFTMIGNQDDPGDMQDHKKLQSGCMYENPNTGHGLTYTNLNQSIRNYKDKRNGTALRTKSSRRSINRLH